MRRILVNYALRHQHPLNRVLHIFGLPVTFVVPIVLLCRNQPLYALASFVAGYAMQFLGHAIEGNDAGEMVLIKKMLGLPYVAIRERPKN